MPREYLALRVILLRKHLRITALLLVSLPSAGEKVDVKGTTDLVDERIVQ